MEGVTLRTLKTAKVSRRRNPLIADLLRRIQLIEAWGRGIPLILEKAPDVRFSQVAGIFITEFPRPLAVENAESGQVAGAQSKAPVEAPVEALVELTETEQRILCALENQTLGSKELLTLLGYRQKTGNYKAAMEKLSALNLIEYTIPGKPNSRLQKYRLTPKGRTLLI
jgi:ATP-dependent DNA helicase RecG